MKKLILTLSLAAMMSAVCAQTAAEGKVWERVQLLTSAIFDKRDSTALLDLVSATVTYGHSSGVIEDKATMVHKAMVSKVTYRNRLFEKVSIDVRDRMAVVRHNFRAISIDETGKESPLDLGILQVWRKEKGAWRIIARQAVRIPPKT